MATPRRPAMFDLTLAELASLLRDRKVSSEELTRLFLGRIARLDPGLNAFITVDEEKALAAARAADARLGAGAATPLTGIPIAHKDLFCAKGWRTTCGSKMLANFISPYDAHVVEEFDRAGAVLVGKTNMDEFAMGSSNETSFFGPARNPWDPSRVPGGSSGGSAAAVAARLVAAATGTDTGGSIRQPASHTGTSGIRPTYGAVSRYGMVAFASSLDQGGAIGKCADDLARMLNVMAGFDARDSTSVDRPREDYARDLARPLAGIRVGVPKEYFTPELAPDVAACVSRAVEELQTQGATAVEVSLPNQALAVPVYYVIAPAEASSNLARYDGVRFGHRAADGADLFELYCKSRAQGFGAEVQRRILVGTYVLSHGYYDAYYLQAQKVRRLIARDFLEAFKSCDVLAGPAAPSVAFALGEKTNDPVQMYLEDLYTISVNLAGLPALAVPCGFGEGGLPVGLQLIGNYFCEARLLNIAHQYQQATDWHRRCPPGVAP